MVVTAKAGVEGTVPAGTGHDRRSRGVTPPASPRQRSAHLDLVPAGTLGGRAEEGPNEKKQIWGYVHSYKVISKALLELHVGQILLGGGTAGSTGGRALELAHLDDELAPSLVSLSVVGLLLDLLLDALAGRAIFERKLRHDPAELVRPGFGDPMLRNA